MALIIILLALILWALIDKDSLIVCVGYGVVVLVGLIVIGLVVGAFAAGWVLVGPDAKTALRVFGGGLFAFLAAVLIKETLGRWLIE